jgi:hypothetical protein
VSASWPAAAVIKAQRRMSVPGYNKGQIVAKTKSDDYKEPQDKM